MRVYVNVTSCSIQEDALAPYKGNYSGEVSCRRATLIPHLKEEIGS